ETRSDFDQLAALDHASLEELVDELRLSSKPAERALSALLAGKLPVQRGLARLSDLAELDQAIEVHVAAAEALGALPGAASSHELERLARRDEPQVRRAVAAALYKHDDASAFNSLLELARDPDPDTRGWAAWALADGFPPNEARDEALRAF